MPSDNLSHKRVDHYLSSNLMYLLSLSLFSYSQCDFCQTASQTSWRYSTGPQTSSIHSIYRKSITDVTVTGEIRYLSKSEGLGAKQLLISSRDPWGFRGKDTHRLKLRLRKVWLAHVHVPDWSAVLAISLWLISPCFRSRSQWQRENKKIKMESIILHLSFTARLNLTWLLI